MIFTIKIEFAYHFPITIIDYHSYNYPLAGNGLQCSLSDAFSSPYPAMKKTHSTMIFAKTKSQSLLVTRYTQICPDEYSISPVKSPCFFVQSHEVHLNQ
jgi:hypothetical protein